MANAEKFRVGQYRFNSMMNRDMVWTFFATVNGVDYEFEVDYDQYNAPHVSYVTVVGANEFALSDQEIDEIFMEFCDRYEFDF